MKKHLIITGLISLILFSCTKDEVVNENSTDIKWWLMVHPSYENSGIYLYNETKSMVEISFNIPENLTSPHALDYDGKSLWIGGMGDEQSIFELSPNDGSILSEIKNIETEGIACSNDEIYYSSNNEIHRIKKDGTPIETYSVSTNVINDIDIYNSNLYYVQNGATDPIIKFDLLTQKSDTILYSNVSNLYTLTTSEDNFIVVNDLNEIRRFDINSGEIVSDIKINIEGWITAIAQYKN